MNNTIDAEILRRLSLAEDYIVRNYDRNIRLDDIAWAACLSVNHLLRTFKQTYQQSPCTSISPNSDCSKPAII